MVQSGTLSKVGPGETTDPEEPKAFFTQVLVPTLGWLSPQLVSGDIENSMSMCAGKFLLGPMTDSEAGASGLCL